MKYSNIRAFEKHLESASPHHLSEVYVVISKEDFDRKAACSKITAQVLGAPSIAGQTLCAFDAAEVDERLIWEELQSFSFLAPKKVLIVSNAEKLSKSSQDKLRTYFAKPNKGVCLVLESPAVNRATNFYKDAEKFGVILDVAEEKPWEKEKSSQAWVIEKIASEGKSIDAPTAALLVKQLGVDQSTLFQEIEKLICYVGDRKEVTVNDISAICITISQQSAWQLGEVIFRRDASEALRITKALLQDGTALIALLRQIRSQFLTEYQICCMLAGGKTPQDVAQQYPYMKGMILNKHIQNAQDYGMNRFKAGMLAIDETELMAKNSAGDPDWLAERLIFKLASK